MKQSIIQYRRFEPMVCILSGKGYTEQPKLNSVNYFYKIGTRISIGFSFNDHCIKTVIAIEKGSCGFDYAKQVVYDNFNIISFKDVTYIKV